MPVRQRDLPLSPLLQLPRELRDVIYSYALYYPTGLSLCPSASEPGLRLVTAPRGTQDQISSSSISQQSAIRNPTALSQTNTQLRIECASLVYSLNTFHFLTSFQHPPTSDQPIWGKGILDHWLDRIGPRNRACLQHLDVDLGIWSHDMLHSTPRPASTTTSGAEGAQETSSVTTTMKERYYSTQTQAAAGYVLALRHWHLHTPSNPCPCIFSLQTFFSDIPGLGTFRVQDMDLDAEVQLAILREQEQQEPQPTDTPVAFDTAWDRQRLKVQEASADSKIDGQAVVRLNMGLIGCQWGFRRWMWEVMEAVKEGGE